MTDAPPTSLCHEFDVFGQLVVEQLSAMGEEDLA